MRKKIFVSERDKGRSLDREETGMAYRKMTVFFFFFCYKGTRGIPVLD